MKKLFVALIAAAFASASPMAFANCTTQTFIGPNGMQVCTTCCFAGAGCTTTCM